jgi:hypothetical protein
MPKKLEEDLRREVNSKHPDWSQERKDAYVYGTMRETGWIPSTQKKRKLKIRRRKKT